MSFMMGEGIVFVYNLKTQQEESNLSSYSGEDGYFILAEFADFEEIENTLGFSLYRKADGGGVDAHVRFEADERWDFVSFVFFEPIDGDLVFEKIDIYHGKNFLLILTGDGNGLHRRILDDLKIGHTATASGENNLTRLYYHFFSNSLSRMFDSLYRYEEEVTDLEGLILASANKEYFKKIVELRGVVFKIKKHLRFLLHTGDQFVENESGLIPPKLVRNFKSLDFRMNRLFEFSEELCEMAERTLDLYNSAITSRTNNLINKLTIFTVFGMCPTIISGIYGMNFVNMPGLRNEYGYYIALGVIGLSLSAMYYVLRRIKLL